MSDYGEAVGRQHFISADRLAGGFSSAVFKELAKPAPEESAAYRIGSIARCATDETSSLASAFDQAFAFMVRDYRNEYVFKNSLVSKLVFGRHSPKTASALLELRVGNSWADLVVINGTSTTYEIKTDLDQFARLSSQLRDYEARSEFVNVVASDRRASSAEKILPSHVGVLALRPDGSLSTIRAAQSNLNRMTSDHLFSLLRTAEAAEILRKQRGYVLDVPSGEAWKRVRALFGELSVEEAHRGVVSQLRRRGRSGFNLVTDADFPVSLRALAYATELSAVGRQRLLERLRAPAALVLEG
jgi:hypothetical protein